MNKAYIMPGQTNRCDICGGWLSVLGNCYDCEKRYEPQQKDDQYEQWVTEELEKQRLKDLICDEGLKEVHKLITEG